MNIGQIEPTVAEPQLPVPAQESLSTLASQKLGANNPAAGANSALAPQPVAPSVGGIAAQQLELGRPSGQMIALGLDAVAPAGAIRVPDGNRRGEFAVAPDGRPDAAGAPDRTAGGNGAGGAGRGPAGPEGISIAPHGAVPSSTPVVAAEPGREESRFAALPSLMAMARANLRDLSRHSAPSPRRDIPAEEAAVFGSKRFYSMMLNMPNLNSVSGTCIIRFAELKNSAARGELIAPVATEKVDPAYPAELMRDHVEGTVTLYAVIRSDGSVADVRVLSGIDDRLDGYAREALAHWRFQPARKNGNAVDLEAVIRIPFMTRKPGF
jgi:TonB family protein